MKNSKILSLLTAGALVVSSFSGLAMNGGVAQAAASKAYAKNGTTQTTIAVGAASAEVYVDLADLRTAGGAVVNVTDTTTDAYDVTSDGTVGSTGTAVVYATPTTYGEFTITATDNTGDVDFKINASANATAGEFYISTGTLSTADLTAAETTVKVVVFDGLILSGTTSVDTKTLTVKKNGLALTANSIFGTTNTDTATWAITSDSTSSFNTPTTPSSSNTITLKDNATDGGTATLTVTLGAITRTVTLKASAPAVEAITSGVYGYAHGTALYTDEAKTKAASEAKGAVGELYFDYGAEKNVTVASTGDEDTITLADGGLTIYTGSATASQDLGLTAVAGAYKTLAQNNPQTAGTTAVKSVKVATVNYTGANSVKTDVFTVLPSAWVNLTNNATVFVKADATDSKDGTATKITLDKWLTKDLATTDIFFVADATAAAALTQGQVYAFLDDATSFVGGIDTTDTTRAFTIAAKQGNKSGKAKVTIGIKGATTLKTFGSWDVYMGDGLTKEFSTFTLTDSISKADVAGGVVTIQQNTEKAVKFTVSAGASDATEKFTKSKVSYKFEYMGKNPRTLNPGAVLDEDGEIDSNMEGKDVASMTVKDFDGTTQGFETATAKISAPRSVAIKVTATGTSDNGYKFESSKTFTVTLTPAAEYSVRFSPAAYEITSGDKTWKTIHADLVVGNEPVNWTGENLYYDWDVTNANGVEYDGEKDHTSEIRICALDTTPAITGYFGVTVWKDKATFVAAQGGDTSKKPICDWTYARMFAAGTLNELAVITVINNTLDVTVNDVFGEAGYITSGSNRQTFEKAVTIRRANGKSLIGDNNLQVRLYNYTDYLENVQNGNVGAIWTSGATTAAGVTLDPKNGKLTVNANAAGGAFAVVAMDNTGAVPVYGASETPIVIRSKFGLSVNKIEADNHDVVLKNKNDHADVFVTIYPVEYLTDNHSKDEAKSAEVTALKAESSNDNIVEVKVRGNRKPNLENKLIDNTSRVELIARGVGAATITITSLDTSEGVFTDTINVIVEDNQGEVPTPEDHKAGDVFSADGYTVEVLADLTVAIQDAPVVNKTVTIPEQVDGLAVTAIDDKAFKGSSAKKFYVNAAVTEVGKAAWKKSKAKKVFFSYPEALTTVDKNAFAKTNAKVVAVGGSFSKDVAKQLEKAGAKSVKNNGTAK